MSTSVTANASFTNAGNITMTHTGACGGGGNDNVSFGIAPPATLTNTGTLEVDFGSGASGHFLSGNITNAGGTININTNTEYNPGNSTPLTFDNQGRINLADGAIFGDTGGNAMDDTTIINDTGGSIVNSGDSNAGFVQVNPFGANVFDQGGGTTSPSTPNPANPAVVVNGATLNYTGTGASSIEIKGNVSLSGDIAAGQNLTLATKSDCSEGGFVSAAASFTNAGDIALNHIGSCNSGPNLILAVPGTLTNTGTVEIDHNGTDTATNSFLAGNLMNAGGTLAVNTDTGFNGEGLSGSPFTLDNKGTIKLADSAILFDQTGQTVINDTGGSISNSGDSSAGFLELQSEQGNIFDQGAGTTSPSVPDPVQPAVVVAGSSLNYTGTGASTIDVQGQCCVDSSITGNIAAHQNLVIEAGCGEHSTPSTPGSLTNAGIVIFRDNPCGSGQQVALNIGGGGTLTNRGTLASLAPFNDSATINGTLTNAGAMIVAKGDQLTLNGTLNNYRSATGTLIGGTYLLSGTFQDRDGALVANGIVNDAASIVLSGGSFIDSNDTNALRNLASIASKSLFMLIANQSFSTVGSLSNAGTVVIGTGSTLTVNGNYVQTASAIYGEGVTTTSAYGLMKVTGTSTLAGTLAIVAPRSFSGTQGAVLTPLTASSNSGTFAKVTGAGPYTSGDSFAVGYTSTGFTLTVQG